MNTRSPRARPAISAVLWFVVAVMGAPPAGAQAVDPPGAVEGGAGEAPPKRMAVARVDPGSIALDGRLDEEAWAGAAFRTDFTQRGRDRGFDPRVATRVAFLYDDEALFVGAWMEHDPRGGVGPLLGARDDAGNSERILVFLDTYRDRTTAYAFGVTRGGVRVDYVNARDIEGWQDDSFDPLWAARVASDSTGWTAEMRIPFSQLRFSPGEEQVWGINVRRWNPSTYLNTYWVMVPYEDPGWVSRFGELHGIAGISGGAGAEIVPYVVEEATYLDSYYGGDGTPAMETRVGGDLKLGLGSNLTLDATVNPDFGQVEADPARVNLTAYETFFPERRPFFIEGRELFRTPGPTWFYSRRIGAVPPDAGRRELFEQVESTSILGGGKLTGRTPDGLSVGGLAAVTGRSTVPTGTDEPVEVAPRTAYGVLRLQREVGEAGSSLGVVGTAVERFLPGGGTAERILPRRAWAGGGDFVLRLGGGAYEISGFAGASRVMGSVEAIRRRSLSSAHFFQRPDADHVTADGDRTHLIGWTAGFKAGRVGGIGWQWDLDVSAESPGFEIRDLGAQLRGDVVDARAAVSYVVRDGRGTLRNRTFGAAVSSGWNFGGIRRAASSTLFLSAGWSNQWTTYLEAGMNQRALSDDLTRGGPLMTSPRSWWTDLRFSQSGTGNTEWSVEGDGFLDELGGWSTSLSGGLTLQPSRYLGLSLYAGGSLGDDSRQYVQRVDGGPDATFGRRYVFSWLERRELFARLRGEIAFAPDAVLTLYAEPFVSSARSHRFGELVAARSRYLRRYGTDGTSITRLEDGAWEVVDGEDTFRIENFDFWVRSFRGSAVLRWEWRTGSLLHLIWRREQWLWDPKDGPTAPGTLLRSLDDPGMDVFLVKLSVFLGTR